MNPLQKQLVAVSVETAMEWLTATVRDLLQNLDDRQRADFVVRMIGNGGADKIAGMVDL